MAQTYNEALLDAMIRHQTGLLRFSGSVRNRIWELLDATEKDLKAEIARRVARSGFDTPARLRSLDTLLERLRETRIKGWKDARAVWFEEMRSLAVAEPKFFQSVIVSVFPVELGSALPDPTRLRQIVTSRPFEGKTLSQWAKQIETVDIARIEDAIKIGLVQGEGPLQISRRIVGTAALRGRDGVTQITRRNAAAITRTVASGVAAEGRREFLLANKDLAPEEVFTATLDSRTTPICQRFDGQKFKVGEGPRLPLHFNERSIYSPVFDGQVIGQRPRRDFTQRQLLREYAEKNGIKATTSRARLPRGHKGAFDTFARARMRELTGQAPASLSYGTWLSQQTASFQNDLLGPTRGLLFRKGGLKLDRFVEYDGTAITLAQLAERHTEAFLRAGLDPSSFR